MYDNNVFTGAIAEDGTIYIMTAGRRGEAVGIDNQRVEEMQEIIDKYYNKLVELGVIKLPKTPEQIIEEQNQMMHQMLLQMQQLQNEMREMKSNGDNGHSTELSDKQSGQDSKQNRKVASRGKASNPTGETDTESEQQ